MAFIDTKLLWVNGEIIPKEHAKIDILTHGLHYGSAVFEGIRIYKGNPFKLRDHMERLIQSARMIALEVPYTCEELIVATNLLIEKERINEGYIRPIAWCDTVSNLLISNYRHKVHVAIAAWEAPVKPFESKQDGVRLCLSKWRRPLADAAPVHSKCSGLYVISSMSKAAAEKAGYEDALMLDQRGYIAEASTANIFFAKNNELYTPISDCFLNGITRLAVIEIAKNLGIKVHETIILPTDLGGFEEAFTTGTAGEITPIAEINMDGNTYVLPSRTIATRIYEMYYKLTRG